MPIKSVHITNYYDRHSGGISTSYNNLMDAAARHQRHVRLIVPGESDSVEDVNEFARIYFVTAKQSPVFDKRYRILLPWQYLKGDSKIREILLAEKPDLVEVCDKYTLSMMGAMILRGSFAELGRPVMVHFSCERMDDNVASFMSKGSFGKWLASRVVGNFLMPSFDYHLANSTYTAGEFAESLKFDSFLNRTWRFLRAPRVLLSERTFVCPRGVNAAIFRPDRRSEDKREIFRQKEGIPQDAVMLLYAGRISPEKNVELLVDMMIELGKDEGRDYRLLVAGAGPKADWLREQTDEHFPGKIIQLGHLDKEELADVYANADIFVHPNPKEPFGIAPLEAMASGVPVVAPRSGGILSYATDDNVWLVEPVGWEFAEAIFEILEDPALTEAKTANAVATALENTREFATDRLFATYDKIYGDFTSRRELFTDRAAAADFDYAELNQK
ncbi:MAG: glycosyltransferase [Blastocatellia bacterium]|nr:glycosyltransferase [Blastocatellia bacterium]